MHNRVPAFTSFFASIPRPVLWLNPTWHNDFSLSQSIWFFIFLLNKPWTRFPRATRENCLSSFDSCYFIFSLFYECQFLCHSNQGVNAFVLYARSRGRFQEWVDTDKELDHTFLNAWWWYMGIVTSKELNYVAFQSKKTLVTKAQVLFRQVTRVKFYSSLTQKHTFFC